MHSFKNRFLKSPFASALIVAFVIGVLVTSARAQQGGDEVTLALSATPSQLVVGEEAAVTLAITGQEGAPCTVAVTQPADVVLVMDVSDSMDDDGKLMAAKSAAQAFLDQMNLGTDQVAIVAFSDQAFTVQNLTQNDAVARAAVENLETISGTDIAAGLQEGIRIFSEATHRSSASTVIVLLSDGQSNPSAAEQAAAQAMDVGITIYTVSLGNDAERSLMEALASYPSNYYHAPATAELSSIYRTIQTQIASATASNVIIHAEVNTAAWELIPPSTDDAATVTGNHITWTVGTLTVGQTQQLTAHARAVQVGQSAVLRSIQMDYDLCGDQPRSLNPMPGPTVIVLAPPTPLPTPTPVSPCTQEPLSNDCFSSLVCMSSLVWPCTALGLPWWVCLLIPLLLAVALLLWFWQRRKEQARQAWQPPHAGPITSPPLDTSPWQLLPTPTMPPPLPVSGAQIVPYMNSTLVIGIGHLGQGAIESLRDTLEEAYGNIPQTVRLLIIHPSQGPSDLDDSTVVMPLSIEAARAMIQQDAPELDWLSLEIESELAGGEIVSPHSQLAGRTLGRLALFRHRPALEARLRDELKTLGSDSSTIYVVGSLAEGYASGALLDIAHLTRLLAQELLPNSAFHGLLLLPESHTEQIARLDEYAHLQQVAAAAWRELDRFQSVFEHAYPLDYGDQYTQRRGKLFDRCYLFSPDRSEGPGLTGRPITETLYPAIADLIIALTDTSLHSAWETVARSVAERSGRQQHQRGEALYSSLGSFTYVLPIEDLIDSAALELVREMIAGQLGGGLSNPRETAQELFSRPVISGKVFGAALMRDVAQRADLTPEQFADQISALGVEVASLLSPSHDDETRQATVTSLHHLTSDYVVQAVRTSADVCADAYGSDTHRFLKDVGRTHEQLASLDVYLENCLKEQAVVFRRALVERLLDALNPSHRSDSSGLMNGLDLVQAVDVMLSEYRQGVAQVAASVFETLDDVESEASQLHSTLLKEASNATASYPRLSTALLRGIIPATAAVIGLGLGALAAPTLLLPLGGIALLATGIGAWGSWYALRRTPELVRQQVAYRDVAQSVLALRIEHHLYNTWVQIVDQWLEIVRASAGPLRAWRDTWGSSEWNEALGYIETLLAKRYQDHRAIRVRRYLDNDRVRETLYQHHVAPVTEKEEYNRFIWSYNAEHEFSAWTLTIVGAQHYVLHQADIDLAVQALMDVGRAFASGLRSLQIADVLAELHTPETIAQECGPGSAPLIRIAAHEQPLNESHRFIGVAGETQTLYFDQVVQALRRPAAQVHSEQRAMFNHPYRCVVLTSLDLLRNAGLPAWEQARRSYGNLLAQQRVTTHVFPAECTAVHYEGLLSQIGLAWRVFSPQAVLTLEDARRARAFWRAYALGWIRRVPVERGGASPWYQMALVLPDARPLALTESREETPSLWQAAAAFVLGEPGAHIESVETAWTNHLTVDFQERRARMRDLEKTLDAAQELQRDRHPVTQELGILLHLMVEDALRKLDGEPGFWEE